MHLPTIALLLPCAAWAQEVCYSDRSTLSDARPSSSSSGNGYSWDRFQEFPARAPRPTQVDPAALTVEWQSPVRFGAGCVRFLGRLMVEQEGVTRPVDWFQGVRVLVARRPGVASGWADGHDYAETVYDDLYLRPDGRFEVGIREDAVLAALDDDGAIEVGIALAEHDGQRVVFRSSHAVVASSVAVLPLATPPVFDLETYRSDHDVRITGRGPRDALNHDVLLPYPKLAPRPPPASPDEAQVRAWIDALQHVTEKEAAYAHGFLPLPSVDTTWRRDLLDRTPSLLETGPLLELERAGPAALPLLLAHLDDARPTPTLVDYRGVMFGDLRRERRLSGNPLNPRELRAFGDHLVASRFGGAVEGEDLTHHRVTVGDLCFVALGQIANRASYRALEYQPTACTVVDSPVGDPEVARMVRAAWGGGDARAVLLESLLIDFHSRGWAGAVRQTGAAARLLLYYPEETEHLVAARIDGLVFGEDPQVTSARNRVNVKALLSAVSWCRRPVVQAALLRVLLRTSDSEVQMACFHKEPYFSNPVVRKLTTMWATLPAEEGSFGHTYDLTWATLSHAPTADAHSLLLQALEDASAMRAANVCRVFQHVADAPPWAVDLLEGLLDDRRETGWRYAQVRWYQRPSSPVLVCDEAALAIGHLTEQPFALEGTRAAVDAQLEALRAALR